MVYRTVRFRCEKCRTGYSSYNEAWDCELGHVTDDAIAGFKGDLDRIFGRNEKYPVIAKASDTDRSGEAGQTAQQAGPKARAGAVKDGIAQTPPDPTP